MITYTYKVVLLGNCYVGKTTFFKKVKGNIEFPVSDAGRHSDSLDMASCILEIRLPGSPTSRILVSQPATSLILYEILVGQSVQMSLFCLCLGL